MEKVFLVYMIHPNTRVPVFQPHVFRDRRSAQNYIKSWGDGYEFYTIEKEIEVWQ